jgi:hypothetical protein
VARQGGGAEQIFWILGFALLTFFGYRQRRNPRTHKRLMLTATIMLLPAPLVRWPILIAGNFPLAVDCCYVLLAVMVCYDLWSTRKLQPGTLWGSAIFIVTHQPIVSAFTHNIVWLRIATGMKGIGQFLR